MTAKAGQMVSQYCLVEKIGEGGMGVVWKASDTVLRRTVALKFLSPQLTAEPQARTRFLREARSASALDHPNIGTIHEASEHGGQMFIAMAYYEGQTLDRRLGAGPLDLGEAMLVLEQIAEALAAAHAASIVHRDIKPANVMLTRVGQVKVLDFGLAKQAPGAQKTETRLTSAGGLIGTVAYMSPEQARGEAVDHRTDLWSLGVMAYEMLTGRCPFAADSAVSILARILTEEPAPLGEVRAGIPEGMARLVEGLLKKDPKLRIPSAREVIAELSRIQQQEGSQALTRPLPGEVATPGEAAAAERTERPARTRTHAAIMWLSVIGGLAVLIAAGVTLVPTGLRWGEGRGGPVASLVTMPCRVYGPSENSFLSFAIPRTLTGMLDQVSGLDARLPSVKLQPETRRSDLLRVARAYGVAACLTCSVLAEADQIVVNLQLVRPEKDEVIWTQKLEGRLGSYLDLVHRAAEEVKDRLALTRGNGHALAAATASSDAELAFQRGVYHLDLYKNRGRQEDFEAAEGNLRRASDLDPNMAQAPAEIAWLYRWNIEIGGESNDRAIAEMEKWARRALEIDGRCGVAWAALAWAEVERTNRSWRKVLEYGLRAASVTPRDPRAHDVISGLHHISFELASATDRAADRLDPFYLIPRVDEALGHYYLGRSEQALSVLDQVLELDPQMRQALSVRLLVLIELGRVEEASRLVEEETKLAQAEAREPPLFARHALAWTQSDRRKAEGIYGEILRLAMNPRTSTHDLEWIMVRGVPPLARHGEKERAIELLTRCVAGGADPVLEWLEQNPVLASIRSDPRLASIFDRARKRRDQVLEVVMEARSRGELPSYLEGPLENALGGIARERTAAPSS